MPHALAVDDDPNFLTALAELIEAEGFSAHTATNLRDARDRVLHKRPDVALIDLRLPDGSGMDLLEHLDHDGATKVILITGHADVESAIEALRMGASDYLTKPLDVERLREILGAVARAKDPTLAPSSPLETALSEGRLGLLLGASPPMQEVYRQLTRVARTDATVFLVGESGSGKDLAAQTLHQLSARSSRPFLPLNCGAISPTLIESELFGHERGAFTGAARQHKGYFERSHGGTLFLDEISEMPIELQVKLLRVLETGVLVRIGGDQEVEVDVRVVAATNRDPRQAVDEGKLREDLFYRLSVFPVGMPPLRDREGDVELLARFFLHQLNADHGSEKSLTDGCLERLAGHRWPGNVRELKNVLHRAFILADDDDIEEVCLPEEIGGRPPGGGALRFELGASIAEVERELILATLERHGGNKRRSAEVLGISLKTLYNRLNAYREEGDPADEAAGDRPD
jgi:DNA-binding NtrC family response regulator